jgi:hypothetical protein
LHLLLLLLWCLFFLLLLLVLVIVGQGGREGLKRGKQGIQSRCASCVERLAQKVHDPLDQGTARGLALPFHLHGVLALLLPLMPLRQQVVARACVRLAEEVQHLHGGLGRIGRHASRPHLPSPRRALLREEAEKGSGGEVVLLLLLALCPQAGEGAASRGVVTRQ